MKKQSLIALFLLLFLLLLGNCSTAPQLSPEILEGPLLLASETQQRSAVSGPLIFPEGSDLWSQCSVVHNSRRHFLSDSGVCDLAITDSDERSLIEIPLPQSVSEFEEVSVTLSIDVPKKKAPSPKTGKNPSRKLKKSGLPPLFHFNLGWRSSEGLRIFENQRMKKQVFSSTKSPQTFSFSLLYEPEWKGRITSLFLVFRHKISGQLTIRVHELTIKRYSNPYLIRNVKIFQQGESLVMGYQLEAGSSLYSKPLTPEGHVVSGACRLSRGESTGTALKVFYEDESGTEKLLFDKEWLGSRVSEDGDSWKDYTFRLPDTNGQPVRLIYRNDSGSEIHGDSAAELVFSLPHISAPRRPRGENVILVSIDTLRKDHLGCYGYPIHTSPNIDRISKVSTLFSDVISQSPSTLPSHATMFTSTIPLVHMGIGNFHELNFEHPLLAEYLLKQGFSTVGVTGGGAMSRFHHFYRGFITFTDAIPGIISLRKLFLPAVKGVKEKRFFGFYHTYEVHREYRYVKNITEYLLQSDCSVELLKLDKNTRFSLLKKPENHACLSALYDTDIRVTDSGIQELVTFLGQEGLLDKTSVLITSDHGEHLGEYGLFGHSNSLFRELLEVPLIIKTPQREDSGGGQILSKEISLLEIVPTICELMELPIPDWAEGNSLVSQSAQPGQKRQEIFSMNHQQNQDEFTLTTDFWKFFRDEDGQRSISRFEIDEEKVSTSIPPEVSENLEGELDRILLEHPPPSKERTLSADDDIRQQLRQLGYME